MGNLRIIGGKWRGRKLQFPTLDGVRPTGDRIRETLFNWLMYQLAGKRCLDLFAGSGALGLEALSRGAGHVTFIESDKKVHSQLASNLALLKAENYQLIYGDALAEIAKLEGFDLVFLDPPFQKELLQETLKGLIAKDCLNEGAQLYVESESHLELDFAGFQQAKFTVLKEKSTGNVNYYLLRYEAIRSER